MNYKHVIAFLGTKQQKLFDLYDKEWRDRFIYKDVTDTSGNYPKLNVKYLESIFPGILIENETVANFGKYGYKNLYVLETRGNTMFGGEIGNPLNLKLATDISRGGFSYRSWPTVIFDTKTKNIILCNLKPEEFEAMIERYNPESILWSKHIIDMIDRNIK